MKFSCEQHFNAPVERVLKMYSDVEYISAKYASMGLRDVKLVELKHDDHSLDVTYHYLEQASIPIPAIARRFIGDSDWFAVYQNDRWQFANQAGELNVTVVPFKNVTSIRCDMNLVATANGCVNQMNWDVSCSVPLLGGTLAKLLAEDIQRKVQRDGEMAQKLLLSQY